MPIMKRGRIWYWRHQINGRDYRGSTGLAATKRNETAARRIAKMKLAELQEKLRAGVPERSLFEDTAGEFLEWCREVEYREKPNTAHRIKTSFATLQAFFAGRIVAEITPADVEAYKEWRTREHQILPVTLKHDLNNLSLFYRKWAVRRGLAQRNPVAEVTKPSDRDAERIHVVTAEEEKAYFAAADTHDSPLADVARLILWQGCRPEEIMTLRPADVDLQRGELRIAGGKTRAARRRLTLIEESAAILRRRLAGARWWLFPSKRYGPQHHITKLSNIHDRVCQDAGVSFVLYDLRHTFATRMVESGCDLPTLAAILGHASLRMVMRYVHPTAAHQAAAMKRYQERHGARPRAVNGGEQE